MMTLDQIVVEPARAVELTAEERLRVLLACAGILTAIAAAPVEMAKAFAAASDEEKLLDAEQAAQLLNQTAYWVRRHARELPFAVRIGRGWRFSAAGIARFIRRREGNA